MSSSIHDLGISHCICTLTQLLHVSFLKTCVSLALLNIVLFLPCVWLNLPMVSLQGWIHFELKVLHNKLSSLVEWLYYAPSVRIWECATNIVNAPTLVGCVMLGNMSLRMGKRVRTESGGVSGKLDRRRNWKQKSRIDLWPIWKIVFVNSQMCSLWAILVNSQNVVLVYKQLGQSL